MNMNGVPYLPIEIWGLIFLRGKLPVKFLGQSRRVCKCWDSLIGSKEFREDYNESEAGKTDRVLVKSELTCDQWGGVLLFRPGADREDDLPLQLPIDEGRHGFRIIGSCKGLVCICLEIVMGKSGRLVIWNPSIDRFRRLPRGLNRRNDEIWDSDTPEGFGYGERDYKIVRIAQLWSDSGYTYGADVYSLRLNSWSRITTIPELNGSRPVHFRWHVGTYFDGALYWLYWIGDLPDRHMLWFDIGSETFTTEPLRDSIPLRASTIDVSIGVFKNALSLFHMREEGVFIHCEIWVKGENDTWVYKRHLMNPGSFKIARPFSGTSDHMFHMLLKNEDWPVHHLVLYDLMSRNSDDSEIEIQCSLDNYVGEYEESFTLLE